MNITKIKNAGFCFGVKRAIDGVNEILDTTGEKIYCIGPLIHNEKVTNELTKKGLRELNDMSEITNLHGENVVIRTHGIEKDVYDILKNNDNKVIDMTCPFVSKIHKLVSTYSEKGYKIIVIGDKNHPEVKGIVSYAKEYAYVIGDEKDIDILNIDKDAKILVVFQTTMSVVKGQKLVDILKELFYNCIIEYTICNATELRQDETRELSKSCDAMFIVGSNKSSNTKKLYEVAKENCTNTYILNDLSELPKIGGEDIHKIGISAGASTPEYLIEEIIEHVRNEF